MLRERATHKQEGYEIVLLEELVPEDHVVRKIAAAVEFGFIHDLCKDQYCLDNGRPAIEPEVLFKMLTIGYLFGIKSETRIAEEVECNVAYRWFLGLGLRDKVPEHATISINRARRFRDNNIAEQIFDEILRQAKQAGLVGGAIEYTDSTHIKAKANKHKKVLIEVEQTPKSYLSELDEQIERDRAALGKKPFDKDDDQQPPTTTRMQSKTDPDSGQLNKEGKPDGFHYKLCRNCPRRSQCISAKANRRQVTRHVWQDWLDKATAFTKSPAGRAIYNWRKETIEPSFAESKENHALRTARMVGLANVREQCFLTCAVQNMKKMAKAFFLFFLSCYHANQSRSLLCVCETHAV